MHIWVSSFVLLQTNNALETHWNYIIFISLVVSIGHMLKSGIAAHFSYNLDIVKLLSVKL